MAAALAELFDDALELNGAEAVAGLLRPALDLRHQKRVRVAQRPQRGLQARGSPRRSLGAVGGRRGCGAHREEQRSWIVGTDSALEKPAAPQVEKAAPGGEEGRGGHGVVFFLSLSLLLGLRKVCFLPHQ